MARDRNYPNGSDNSRASTTLKWVGPNETGYQAAQRSEYFNAPPATRHNNLVVVPTMEIIRNSGTVQLMSFCYLLFDRSL